LQDRYLAAGRLPPGDGSGCLPGSGCGSGDEGGTMDALGITYRGAFLEDLFDPGDGLFTG